MLTKGKSERAKFLTTIDRAPDTQKSVIIWRPGEWTREPLRGVPDSACDPSRSEGFSGSAQKTPANRHFSIFSRPFSRNGLSESLLSGNLDRKRRRRSLAAPDPQVIETLAWAKRWNETYVI
jgi:hypothetical protein